MTRRFLAAAVFLVFGLFAGLWLKPDLYRFVAAGVAIPPVAEAVAQPFDVASVPLTLKITFGLQDAEPADWDGVAHLDRGEFLDIQGWVFDGIEQVHLPTVSWQVKSKAANFDTSRNAGGEPEAGGGPRRNRYGSSPTRPVGVWLQLRAPADATLTVNTVKGEFRTALSSISDRQPTLVLSGRASIERAAALHIPVTQTAAQEDYPSIAAGPNGRLHAAWISYQQGGDQVLFSSLDRSGFSRPLAVSEGNGICASTLVAVDGKGRVWVIYNQLDAGQFDLWARQMVPSIGKAVRLTNGGGNNIHPRAHADRQGNIWLVWQGLRDGNSDIFLRRAPGFDKAGREFRVTSHPANDWDPDIAVDQNGNAVVVWDTYRNGDYDVYMRTVDQQGKLGSEIPVSATASYEAHASAVFDTHDRLWIAWEESGAKWGKDTGQESTNEGSMLHTFRQIGLRSWQNGHWFQLQNTITSSLQKMPLNFQEQPRLAVDTGGKVWLVFRQWISRQNPPEVWNEYAVSYDGAKWSEPVLLPRSDGRLTQELSLAAHPDGSIWAVYSTDYRGAGNGRRGQWDIYCARLQDTSATLPLSGVVEAPVSAPSTTFTPTPNKGYQTQAGSTKYRLFYGDLHRHTDIRGHGGTDPSVPDLYRYALDAAELDFMATTDHNLTTGNAWSDGLDEYAWWVTQKNADLHMLPGRFVSLYGYERSMVAPGGHRNVIWPNRKNELIPGDRRLASENIPLGLWERLRRTGGIAIPHTIAEKTQPNVSWEYHDPVGSPVMEMYQGARSSYEYAGAKPEESRGRSALEKKGNFLWDALERGYRIGVIASSDHGSTHQSYAGVYATDFTREAIVEAIRNRHTFAATDNIVIDFRIGDAFMGDEVTLAAPPRLAVKVLGTGPIRQVDIVRNNKFVYTAKPGKREAEISYLDQDTNVQPSGNYYYVRVIQENEMMAWSSAIWVKRQ
ncbi:MAG TPA: DUF3604 domain-containing protein [Acidobacteriota bacterium]|jgi:hypothetical protein